MDKDFLIDRFTGCLLGLAIGDAMGAPVYGMTPLQVMSRYHFIDGFYPTPARAAGKYTSETQSAMLMANALERAGRFDEIVVGQAIAETEKRSAYQPSDGAKTVFSRFVPVALLAAGTGLSDQEIVNCCKFVAAPLNISKKDRLAVFVFMKTISEVIRNPKEMSKPFELYDADRSLLARMVQMAANSEVKFGEEGIEDRLSEKLSFVRHKLMEPKHDIIRFIGFLQPKGGVAESLMIALFAYMRAPDDFVTVCRMVSVGGASSVYGSMVGALVGATIGSSLMPRDMKDQVEKGLIIEALASSFAGKCVPDAVAEQPTIEEQEDGEVLDGGDV